MSEPLFIPSRTSHHPTPNMGPFDNAVLDASLCAQHGCFLATERLRGVDPWNGGSFV